MRIAFNLYVALGNMAILTMLILLIHECRISFHFFVSSLISFKNILQFSVYGTSVKFMHRYFIIFVAVAKGMFFHFFF